MEGEGLHVGLLMEESRPTRTTATGTRPRPHLCSRERSSPSHKTRLRTEERELKRVKKEESSMVGRMNREERELFVYLSAMDWTDTAPVASAFLTELMLSKDPILALNRVRAPIDRDNWRFVPCKKCLDTFFADGMGARNFFDTPSGFCLNRGCDPHPLLDFWKEDP
jgi:hypothetical protein